MQQPNRRLDIWVIARGAFWFVIPAVLVFVGLMNHVPWLAIIGLVAMAGFAVEVGRWSYKARMMFGFIISAPGGTGGLAIGIRDGNWRMIILGALMTLGALCTFMILRQERKTNEERRTQNEEHT